MIVQLYRDIELSIKPMWTDFSKQLVFVFTFCIFTLACLGIGTAYAQTYHFNWQSQKKSLLTTVALNFGIKTYDHFRTPENIDEFEDIDPNHLSWLDRKSLYRLSPKADRLSDLTLYSAIAFPALLTSLSKKGRSEGLQIALMGIQGYFIESSVTEIVKIWGERPRPYIYQRGEEVLNQPLSKNATKSFFSGHTATSAYFAFFGAKVFSDLHPDSKWKPVVWTAAGVATGLTGYLRYRAGKHFYSDVITGWIFGASMGILIPSIYKRKNMGVQVSRQGVGISLHF